jgi:hypothetical protein
MMPETFDEQIRRLRKLATFDPAHPFNMVTAAEREAIRELLRRWDELTLWTPDLRCYVTAKRCSDFGCRHEGAQIVGPDYRCVACGIYERQLPTRLSAAIGK